ncbi:ADP-ribosylglycohydrolase family protein [Desulfogranum japonicum]|uniref:ADP-ribosylglycohydrolase family protein n=1 Tax=Desulfogranum japonicum TaxID=231447 RepID=UPI0004090EC9|nr:ADP-ribosylglycohydrolase family protein [Desulfogranum japonicum]
MRENTKAAVLASFAADSLALGAHWIYDTKLIAQTFGTLDTFHAPLPNSFHAGKKKGDFTHYGDQSLVLLESLAENDGFVLQNFAASWKKLFTDSYNGYVDKATKATLDNLNKGKGPGECGSTSTDLGGPARMAPLLLWYGDNSELLLKYTKEQTSMTHNHPATLAGAEFLARSMYVILQGTAPLQAMEEALEQGVADLDLDIRIRSALDSADKDSLEVIQNFGQMCGIASALPGAIHLVARYPHNLKEALVSNVMAGGDSSARGMVAAMMLAAHLGPDSVPQPWLEGLNHGTAIQSLLK